MMRKLVPAVLFGALFLPVPVIAQSLMPTPVEESVVMTARKDLDAASQRLADNDIGGAARAFDELIASPGFASLEEDERYRGLLRAGIVATETGDNAKAHPLLVQASGLAAADGMAWHLRLGAAYALSDYVDSAVCVSVIARRWPESLDQIRGQAIFHTYQSLGKATTQRDNRIAMLAALFDANWTSEGREPNELWFEYTQLLLDRNDRARATEVAARVDSPDVMLGFLVDKRFDALVKARKGVFDVKRTMRIQREHVEKLREREPDRLSPVTDLQEIFLSEGQPERSLALADEVLARIAREGMQVYVDADENYAWMLDSRARALKHLGRWDDAVAQLRKAARRPEHGSMNVSQALNLGRLLAELERPDEAEDTVEDVGAMSPYGRMQLEFTALLVAQVRKDTAAVKKHLAYMREHREDAVPMYQAALVQSNRLDEAATLLVERLKRDDWRREALAEMQIYDEVRETPRALLHARYWREVCAKEEVLRTLEKVGRVQHAGYAQSRL